MDVVDRSIAETIDATQETEYVPKKERFAFYFSAFFRDMSYAIMGASNTFYINILGLMDFRLAFLEGAKRIWDGVNDPIIGAYFDSRPYKDEKARPFFKYTALPVAILLILMFLPFRFSGSDSTNSWLRMGFVLLCYIPFEAMHTLSGTSFMSYYNSITPNIQERGGIIARSRVFSTAGSAVASSGGLISLLIGLVEKDDVHSKALVYASVAVMVGIAFLIFNTLMYTQVKERIIAPAQEGQTLFGILRTMFQNKMFLLIIASSAISGFISAGDTGMLFYDYNVGNTAWQIPIGIAGFPALLLVSWLIPKLTKRVEKRNLMIMRGVMHILCNLLFLVVGSYTTLFTGYRAEGLQPKLFMALMAFLTAIPGETRNVLYWSMIADSVDYGEWKTGKRNDGIIYAAEGLMGKLAGAFGAAASTPLILRLTEYQPNALSQKPKTLKGLFVIPKAIEILSLAAALIPYFFYKLDRKKHAGIIEEIRERKEAEAMIEAQLIQEGATT